MFQGGKILIKRMIIFLLILLLTSGFIPKEEGFTHKATKFVSDKVELLTYNVYKDNIKTGEEVIRIYHSELLTPKTKGLHFIWNGDKLYLVKNNQNIIALSENKDYRFSTPYGDSLEKITVDEKGGLFVATHRVQGTDISPIQFTFDKRNKTIITIHNVYHDIIIKK